MPEDVKAKVEAKNAALKEAIPSDDVAKVGVWGSPLPTLALRCCWGGAGAAVQHSNLPTCCVVIDCPLLIG